MDNAHRNRTIIIVWLLTVLGIVTVGCNGPSPAPQTGARVARAESRGKTPGFNGLPEVAEALANQKPLGPPVKIGAMLDKSGSASWTRVEQPRVQDFQKLLPLLLENGGELAVGVICDNSNRSLVRVRIEPRPVLAASGFHNPQMPEEPVNQGNAFALRKLREEYNEKLAEYNELRDADLQVLDDHRQKLQQWESESEERKERFIALLDPLLERPVDCPSSDIWGGIRRAELFLAENDAAWSMPSRRFAVFITDGLDNVGVRPTSIGSKAEVLLVNGAGSAGVFEKIEHKAFESVSAAFLHLTASTKGGV